jgi:hypothetical protein
VRRGSFETLDEFRYAYFLLWQSTRFRIVLGPAGHEPQNIEHGMSNFERRYTEMCREKARKSTRTAEGSIRHVIRSRTMAHLYFRCPSTLLVTIVR